MIDNQTTELLLDMLYAFLIDYQTSKAAISEEISEKEMIARQRAIVREHAERIEQAIAATLGSGTCSMEYGGDVTDSTKRMLDVYFCSECGSPTYNDCMPYYCMYCGKAVKR